MGGKMDMRKSMQLAAALAFSWAGSAHAAEPSVILPPDLDYATHCALTEVAPLPLDRDWTTWEGGNPGLLPEQVIDLAAEYAKGSERVGRSPETALRMLDALKGQVDQRRLDRLAGRILVSSGQSPENNAAGAERLERAFAGGEIAAALDLAKLYGPNGPRALRDAAKARRFAQIAAASGDANGKLIYATILNADPNAAAEQKSFAIEAALLSMVGDVVAGNCTNLTTVGLLYLRGGLVPADVPAAIAWFEQAAEAGDARTAERLGDLISSPRVETNDFQLALEYYQSAADKGRVASALRVGTDFATGLVRQRDLEQAIHYLSIAADRGSRDGNVWLARLYSGEFGGISDPEKAKDYYRQALNAGSFDADLASELGTRLMTAPPGSAEHEEAKSLFTEAAYAGSGIAAVRLGEMLLGEAKSDPSRFAEVETFMRLGDALGRSEGARHLAELYACAGPLQNPAEAAVWTERAMALGSKNLVFSEGVRLASNTVPAEQARGWELLQRVAVDGDPRVLGFLLARLRADGNAPVDPQLQGQLEQFVARKADDPSFNAVFRLALIDADMELPGAAERLDAALATLDGLIEQNNVEAVLLKADLLKTHRKAAPQDLLPLYQRAAELGVTKAMRELGIILIADPNADIETARGWLQKAAKAGDVKASLRLVDTTAPTAMADLQTIAQSGTICRVDAMVDLARTYRASIDPAAEGEAARWLVKATEAAGDRVTDLVRVASAYKAGIGGIDQVAAAEPLLSRAMQMGSTEAAKSLATGHLDGLWPDADPDMAQQLLAGLAQEGDADAAARLLRAIADGKIEAPADAVATLVAQSQAQLDDKGRTLTRLARLDEDGTFGAPDSARRLEWLERAAEAGDVDAMMRLYRTYASGIGVAVEPTQAFAWLEKAADVGDVRAARELAAAYAVGFGTPVDPKKAAEWRARAQVVVN